ncbi:MAG: DNA polymerase I [candidate division FCPU426 bacterium]
MSSPRKKLVVLDGMAYAYRSFYAIGEMSNSKGVPTNAIYGFVNALRRAEKTFHPDYAVVAFDSPGGTFRDEMLGDYKGHRDAPPEDLIRQFPLIEEIVPLMGWHLLKLARYEADDIMATLATWGEKKGLDVVLMSSDKDLLQLVGEKVHVYRENPMGGSLYGAKEVVARYGVPPDRITDLLGLMGDAADNIPGVPGIGEKTAAKLLGEYGSLEKVLKAAPKITQAKLSSNLIEFAEQARLSHKLAKLEMAVPLKHDFNSLEKGEPVPALVEKFHEYEFRALAKDYGAKVGAPPPQATVKTETTKGVHAKKTALAVVDLKKSAIAAALKDLDPKKLTGIHVLVGENISVALAQGAKAVVASVSGWKQVSELLGKLDRPIFFESKATQCGLIKDGQATLEGVLDISVAMYLVQSSRPPRDLNEAGSALGLKLPDLPQAGQDLFEPPAEDLASFARAAVEVGQALQARLKTDDLESLYWELESPLIPVLARMEVAGIRLDVEVLHELERESQRLMKKLETKAIKLAGREFNINSPGQLAKVLFEDLGLPSQKKTKSGFSTDNEVLEKLAPLHELPSVALEYRTLAKLSGTYLQALPRLVDPKDHRLHSTWNQNVAATGRLSSTDPNLQNIPIRTGLGATIRKAFVPDKKGDLILSADYSQIELRILAHYCQDAVLLKAFKDGLDIHTQTASTIFGVRPEKVDAEMRRKAKVINFGVLYGMGPFRISREFHVSMGEAKDFIAQYFAGFPKVAAFLEQCKEDTRKLGYGSTLMGRRRYIPEINSANRVLRESGERTAMNLPIQGSAADLIKKAMLDVDQMLQKKKARSRMLLQVHDELVFEMAAEEKSWLPGQVVHLMENAMKLKAPLKVECGQGKTWFEAKA